MLQSIKRMSSLLLAVCITFVMSVTSFANMSNSVSNSNIPKSLSNQEIQEVTLLVGGMLEYSPEYTNSNFRVGTYIPTYIWDGSNFTIDQSAYRYPVYADDKIVTFYTIIEPTSPFPSKQFGAEFSDKLSSILTETSEYFLVGYDNCAYVVVDGHATLLADYNSLIIDTDKHSLKNISLSEDKLETAISNYNGVFAVNEDQSSLESLKNIIPKQSRADSYKYFKVELYNQGNRNICWAVAATRIGNFMSSVSKTPIQAVNYINSTRPADEVRDSGNILDAQKVLIDLYNLDSDEVDYGFTWEEVRDYIEDATLLYGAFYNASFTNGHAVCVNGYYIDGSKGILIMESLGGSYKQLTANAAGQYKMNYTGLGNLTWEASLVVPWQ